jgi:hypothetical protein
VPQPARDDRGFRRWENPSGYLPGEAVSHSKHFSAALVDGFAEPP